MVVAWAAALAAAAHPSLLKAPTPLLGLLFLARTFTHTGLFIIAHEAIHGSLLPSFPRANAAAGTLCLWLFASLVRINQIGLAASSVLQVILA